MTRDDYLLELHETLDHLNDVSNDYLVDRPSGFKPEDVKAILELRTLVFDAWDVLNGMHASITPAPRGPSV